MQIDGSSDVPLFAQIARQVRTAIADGSVAPGERLPAARELAGALGVNMHTVLRSYAELRDEGLVEMRRSRGVTVTGRAPDTAPLLDLVRRLVSEARRRGLRDDDIRLLLEDTL